MDTKSYQQFARSMGGKTRSAVSAVRGVTANKLGKLSKNMKRGTRLAVNARRGLTKKTRGLFRERGVGARIRKERSLSPSRSPSQARSTSPVRNVVSTFRPSRYITSSQKVAKALIPKRLR